MIYLVNAPPPVKGRIAFPIGISYLARALKLNGFDFSVLDLGVLPPEVRINEFRKAIKGVSGAVFGFGLIIGNKCLETISRYAAMVKEESPDNMVVFGGPLASALPRLLLENTTADYIVMGEGEERFPELLKRLNNNEPCARIDGVVSRSSPGDSIHDKPLKKVADLDKFAPPCYEAFDMDFYSGFYKAHDFCFDIMASRGCRANCSFCFRFIGKGYHSRSAASVLGEIRLIMEKWGVKKFAFREENFLQNKKLFWGLTNSADELGIDFSYRCISRVDDVDEDIVAGLVRGGAISVGMGIESVNQDTLNRINKGIRVEDQERKIELLAKHGIEPRGSFIIGFPEDTEEDWRQMEDFISRTGIKGTVNLLTPLPRTAIFKELREAGLIPDVWEYVKRVDQAYLYQDLIMNLTRYPDEVITGQYQRLKNLVSDQPVIQPEYQALVRA